MSGSLCVAVGKKCYAVVWSYGQICVGCNCCGRINKDRKKVLRARLKYCREQLKAQKCFSSWSKDEDVRKIQQTNNAKNIKFCQKRIKSITKELGYKNA